MSDQPDEPLHPLAEVVRKEIATRERESNELIRLVVRDETKGFVQREEIKRDRDQAIADEIDDLHHRMERIGLPIDDKNIEATARLLRRLLFWSEIGGKFLKGMGMAFLSALGAYFVKKYGPEGWN